MKVILDVDPGVDDAMAMALAFYNDFFDIKLITTVFGNVGLKQTTKNACYLVENYAKTDIPVYSGADRGINTPLVDAKCVHGRTGLGDTIVAVEGKKKTSNRPGYGALEAMRDVILANPNEVAIVATGPQTNVAHLLMKYPEVKDKIKLIAMEVGSTDGKGSITPYASFNAYCDPDAVQYVIEQKIPILLTTKEIGTTAYFEQDIREKFKKAGGRIGDLLYDLCDGYRDIILKHDQYAVHDSCVYFAISKPEMFTSQKVSMKINTTFDEKRAQTKFRKNDKSHITLVTGVDKAKVFKEMERLVKKSRI